MISDETLHRFRASPHRIPDYALRELLDELIERRAHDTIRLPGPFLHEPIVKNLHNP